MMPINSLPAYCPQPMLTQPLPLMPRSFIPPYSSPYMPQAPLPLVSPTNSFQRSAAKSAAGQSSFSQSLGKGALAGTIIGGGTPAAYMIAAATFAGIVKGESVLTKASFAEFGKVALAFSIAGLAFGSLIGAVKGVITSRPHN